MKAILVSVLVIALVMVAFVLVPRAPATSAGKVDILAENETARDLLTQAMRAYRQGDYDASYKLSRAAYLDHFENIEIPLRALYPDLTLDMEYRFAQLRTQMQSAAPAEQVETTVQSVRDGLIEIDGIFSDNGVVAPALAFGASFTIIFREGMEAVLVIAAVLGFLRNSATRKGRQAVLSGVALAIAATAVTWLVIRFLIQLAPTGRELIEGIVSLVAVGVLFWVSFWLQRRLDHKRWMEFLSARASAAMASGSTLGLIGLGFTAIYREGFETALFYEVLFGFTRQMELYVLAGLATGLVVLGIIAWLILRAGRRLPVRLFLRLAVAIVIVLSITFVGQAIQDMQEAGFMNATSLIGIVPRLPRAVADMTGIHPTVETLTGQIVMIGIYLASYAAIKFSAARTAMLAPIKKAA
jgi:high-affinity iron transporter